jgi:hypothetical protein
MVLAVALVALNSFFWLVQGGFALPRAVIADLFGPRLIRAEVLVQTPTGGTADYRIDRGVIMTTALGTITLRELNGELVTLNVASDARVQIGSRYDVLASLRKRMRVTVLRDANGPVSLIQVEGYGK